MSSNAAVQTLFVEFKILPILMVIRSHADLECRRLALDTLLSVLDNGNACVLDARLRRSMNARP